MPINVQNINTHKKLDKYSENYAQPTLLFEVKCGGSTVQSQSIKIEDMLTLIYQMAEGKALDLEGKIIKVISPDGKSKDYPIPADGIIKVEKSQPGDYSVDDSEVYSDSDT